MSISKQFVFIHIPKTAGSNLKLALKPYEVEDPFAYTTDLRFVEFLQQRPQYLIDRGMTFPNHLSICEIQKRMMLDLGEFTKFTVVRDPWQRIYSLYLHYRRDPRHPYSEVANQLPLKGFVDFLIRKLPSGPHVDSLPQTYYLVDDSNRLGVDYVLLFEKLQEALGILCGKLDLTLELPCPEDGSDPQKYRDHCDEETTQMIAEYEQGVIKMVGYRWGQSTDSLPSLVKIDR